MMHGSTNINLTYGPKLTT